MGFQNEGSPRINWVASYPKSGNTWVRLFAAAWGKGSEAGLDRLVRFDDISEFDFQSVCPIPVGKLTPDAEAMLRPAAMLVLSRKIDGPVLVKSHHACMDINGMHLWMPQWTGKVVNPIRDPRDVACSAKHHFGFDSYEQTAQFMNRRDANIGGDGKLHHFLGTWDDHVGSWLRNENLDVHPIRYRDLKADPEGEFTGILQFLGFEDIDPDRVEFAVKAVSFDHMQSFEEEHGFPETSQHQERFFRKGEVGGWKDELPPEVATIIEENHAEMMEHLGFFEGTEWDRSEEVPELRDRDTTATLPLNGEADAEAGENRPENEMPENGHADHTEEENEPDADAEPNS